MLVNEITEIENDESPNIRQIKAQSKRSSDHMGFLPENDGNRSFFPETANGNGPNEGDGANNFDRTQNFAEMSQDRDNATPLNIVYKKDNMFGVTSNINQKETAYTSFRGGASGNNSFMMSSGARLSLGGFDKEMEITNYENALAFGKIGLSLYDPGSYQKISKTPNIYYEPSRPSPIVINEGTTVADRAELPLVDHLGSLASKRRWDDKGAFKIKK